MGLSIGLLALPFFSVKGSFCCIHMSFDLSYYYCLRRLGGEQKNRPLSQRYVFNSPVSNKAGISKKYIAFWGGKVCRPSSQTIISEDSEKEVRPYEYRKSASDLRGVRKAMTTNRTTIWYRIDHCFVGGMMNLNMWCSNYSTGYNARCRM